MRPFVTFLGLWILGLLLTGWPGRGLSAAHGESAAGPAPRAGKRASPPAAAPEPDGLPSSGPEGLDGASWALAAGRARGALALLEGMPEPSPGSEPWFRARAVRARALAALDEHAEAVATLEPVVAHPRLREVLPAEVMAYELARARVHMVDGSPSPEGERQLALAAAELLRLERASPIRNLPETRVERALALARIEGSTPKERRLAALAAERALDRILEDYPNHPEAGQFRLLRAKAQARRGKLVEAASALRQIALTRPGEPESAGAIRELETLAARHEAVRLRPWSPAETLERARHALVLRHVDLARDLVDGLLAHPRLPAYLAGPAGLLRAQVAQKQQDHVTCARELRQALGRTRSRPVREDLSRCLERAGQTSEAIALWQRDPGKANKKGGRKPDPELLWRTIELGLRGGQYARVAELLDLYERSFATRKHARAWLRTWIAYRLGQREAALAGFEKLDDGSPAMETARYFRGKLLVSSASEEERREGARLLRALVDLRPLGYYGLQARQRLLDAGEDPGPLPVLTRVAEADEPPDYAGARRLFAELGQLAENACLALSRADRLHAVGYLEEARRELRIAALEALAAQPASRSEEVLVGLGWRASWRAPRVVAERPLWRLLRDGSRSTRYRDGLRRLAYALAEPYYAIKLAPARDQAGPARFYPRAFRSSVEREAKARGIDPTHIFAVMYTESRFRRHVVSHAGARGALQIMPWTGRRLAERLGRDRGGFDVDDLFDIDVSVRLSTYYLAELLAKFRGQAPLVYASYNGGPENVARWLTAKAQSGAALEMDAFIEEIPLRETYRYARRVMEVQAVYALLYAGRLPRWSNAVDPRIGDNIEF